MRTASSLYKNRDGPWLLCHASLLGPLLLEPFALWAGLQGEGTDGAFPCNTSAGDLVQYISQTQRDVRHTNCNSVILSAYRTPPHRVLKHKLTTSLRLIRILYVSWFATFNLQWNY